MLDTKERINKRDDSSSGHQVKPIDSKFRLSAKPEEQIAATSCRISLGPLTITPTLLPLRSNHISIRNQKRKKNQVSSNLEFVTYIGCHNAYS